MKRVAVLHRNGLFRDCLVTFLAMSKYYEGIPVDPMSVDNLRSELQHLEADVLLLDVNLPNDLAIEIARLVQQESRSEKIILLVPDDHRNLLECVGAGVHGCVLERSSLSELDSAIDRVLQGETACSSDFVATMFSEIARIKSAPNCDVPSSVLATRLTSREVEVLELLAQRQSNKQIAKRLSVSIFTVKNHVHNILEKLEVESRIDAVDRAREERLLSR